MISALCENIVQFSEAYCVLKISKISLADHWCFDWRARGKELRGAVDNFVHSVRCLKEFDIVIIAAIVSTACKYQITIAHHLLKGEFIEINLPNMLRIPRKLPNDTALLCIVF